MGCLGLPDRTLDTTDAAFVKCVRATCTGHSETFCDFTLRIAHP